MDEISITKQMAEWFATCNTEREVRELHDRLNDIIMQESENRVYDLEC